MASGDYESPYLDVLAEAATVHSETLAAESNTDIADAVQAVFDVLQHTRQHLYIKAPQSGDADPDSVATELVWLLGSQVSLSNKPAVTLFGSGGYPDRENAEGTGVPGLTATGGQTIICRNDNSDLTWAMLNTSGQGVTIDRLYWRGAYDTSSHDRPECAIQQTKASGIGTGALTISNCAFDYFDEAIIIGRTGSTVCDRTVVQKCAFTRCGTDIVLNHSQAQGCVVQAVKSESDIIVEANGVGQVCFRDMIYTQSDQVALKIMSSAQNTGTYIFDGYQKIDTQFTGGVLVETETTSVSREALIVINHMTDSRAINAAASGSDTTEKVVKLYGNQVCVFNNCKGIAKIQVGGSDDVNTASSVHRPALPTVILNNCAIVGPNATADPRTLLVKSDGTQAERGVDYTELIVNSFRLNAVGQRENNVSFTAPVEIIPGLYTDRYAV